MTRSMQTPRSLKPEAATASDVAADRMTEHAEPGSTAERSADNQDRTLFDPVSIRGHKINNRLVYPAVVSLLGREGRVTSQQIEYYERRARGGVGLIVTEGMSIHPSSRPHSSIIEAYNPDSFTGLQELASRVQRHGTQLLMQLWHVGRQLLWGPAVVPWGISELPDGINRVVPHVMTTQEIETIIGAYIDTAVVAQRAGFSGIEVHGAHGYLITQALSPVTNNRKDEFGGSAANRARLLVQVLAGIRKACGPDFIVALKLTGTELVEGGLTADDSATVARMLVERALIDVLTVAQGNFTLSLDGHVPDMTFPPMPFREVLLQLREASRPVPFISVGRITERSMAEEVLDGDEADLIALARPLISDPDLPLKWSGALTDPVRPCIYCNVCWDATRVNRPVRCIHNPDVISGSPATVSGPAETSRRIHVIGAGPAGMEAAWVAAARGHRVTLWDESAALGGQARFLASTPQLTEYNKLLGFQIEQLRRHEVDVRLNHSVDAEALDALGADTVVIATGATPQAAPHALSSRDLKVIDPTELDSLIADGVEPGHVVVLDDDGGFYAYSSLLKLLERGWRATLATPSLELGAGLGFLTRIRVERILRKHMVQVLRGYRLLNADNNVITVADVCTGEPIALPSADLVVWAGPRVARDDLQRSHAHSVPIVVIGDAMSPRDITTAISEGRQIGEAL